MTRWTIYTVLCCLLMTNIGHAEKDFHIHGGVGLSSILSGGELYLSPMFAGDISDKSIFIHAEVAVQSPPGEFLQLIGHLFAIYGEDDEPQFAIITGAHQHHDGIATTNAFLMGWRFGDHRVLGGALAAMGHEFDVGATLLYFFHKKIGFHVGVEVVPHGNELETMFELAFDVHLDELGQDDHHHHH